MGLATVERMTNSSTVDIHCAKLSNDINGEKTTFRAQILVALEKSDSDNSPRAAAPSKGGVSHFFAPPSAKPGPTRPHSFRS